MQSIVKGLIGLMRRRTPNRKHSYDSMCERIKSANDYYELDFLLELASELLDSRLITHKQYSQLHDAYTNKRFELLVRDIP